MKRTVSGILLVFLLMAVFSPALNVKPVKSEPRTIIVPDDYPTIQEAINAANPGDTIFVRAGTYYENVVVNKSVLLVGENKELTLIDGDGIGNVVSVIASNVIIHNFTIQNSGNAYEESCL